METTVRIKSCQDCGTEFPSECSITAGLESDGRDAFNVQHGPCPAKCKGTKITDTVVISEGAAYEHACFALCESVLPYLQPSFSGTRPLELDRCAVRRMAG
jgi:hypothetical protein